MLPPLTGMLQAQGLLPTAASTSQKRLRSSSPARGTSSSGEVTEVKDERKLKQLTVRVLTVYAFFLYVLLNIIFNLNQHQGSTRRTRFPNTCHEEEKG